jgi:chorismate-pyruvate lyase
MVAMTARSRLEWALRQNGSTVTAFLEHLAGEPVDAHERRHATIQAASPNSLFVDEGYPLLRRSALLRGRRSAQPYLYAESILVPSRLPNAVLWQLRSSMNPIGRILADEGIDFTRTPLPSPQRSPAIVSGNTPVPEEYLLARTHQVDIDGLTVMVIAEWFLLALEPFLAPG